MYIVHVHIYIYVLIPHLSKAAHHLLYEWPHWGDVDDLELIRIDRAIGINVFPYLPQHTQ